MKNNISKVVKRELCLGCGACVIGCNFDAIKMYYNESIGNYQPYVINKNCRECGDCLEVCFGNNVDYDLSNNIQNEFKSSIGNIIKTYLGYSSNKKLRFNSSSGGIVSTLLEFLFNKNLIDGAIVVKINSGRIPLAKSIIIQNKSGIIETIGSKYIPTLLTNALMSLKEKENYALVGLPCQIFAINKLLEKKKIKCRIFLKIGIFCGGIFNYNALKFLMQKYEIKENFIKSINFRGKGWPGKLSLISKSNVYQIPYLNYWTLIQPWFSPRRCEICISGFNKDSDISCGDAWLSELIEKDKLGTSIIISRTKKGNSLLERIISENHIQTEEVNSLFIIKSQKSMIRFKYLSVYTRLKILKLLFKKPFFEHILHKKQQPIYISALIDEFKLQIGKYLAKREKTWYLFKIFTKLYNYMLYFTENIKKKLTI